MVKEGVWMNKGRGCVRTGLTEGGLREERLHAQALLQRVEVSVCPVFMCMRACDRV